MRSRKQPLDRDRVVDTALAILDREGLDGVTVRNIAAALGVANPALYWHFKSKQQIVDAMAQRIVAAGAVVPRGAWRTWLRATARAFRAAMLAHKDGARVVASANLGEDPGLALAVQFLVDGGVPRTRALAAVVAAFHIALGAAFEHQGDPAPRKRRERDLLFERGLAMLLDGV